MLILYNPPSSARRKPVMPLSLLALDVTPMSWPQGSGQSFKGTYDLAQDRIE